MIYIKTCQYGPLDIVGVKVIIMALQLLNIEHLYKIFTLGYCTNVG